ncbi:MAG: hypothetical protein ACYTEO_17970 [Planctomycetota bacterium]|jgi:hypothetical protein
MHKRQNFLALLSVILLLCVMGGRTALFVALFDAILRFGPDDHQLSILALFMALALVLAVPVAAYFSTHAKKKGQRQLATAAMIGAAAGDGYFNIAEALILAQESATLRQFAGTKLQLFFDFGVVLIGVLPTLLTLAMMRLVGSLSERKASGDEANPSGQSGTGWPRKCAVCGKVLFASREAQGHWRADDHRAWKQANPGAERYISA